MRELKLITCQSSTVYDSFIFTLLTFAFSYLFYFELEGHFGANKVGATATVVDKRHLFFKD